MAGKGMIYGNLTICRTGKIIELSLNTYNEGYPRAQFTPREIPKLIELLRQYAEKEPDTILIEAQLEPEEIDEWASLI